jgi:hypothetical protein
MELGLFTAAAPASLRILRTNPDGSGVVEMPILRAGTINRALTSGGGEGELTITPEDLAQMAANFSAWPGPVPINVQPHRSWADTAGAAPGFIEGMEVRDDHLYARIFLTSNLFREVAAGQWRGFSVDIAKGIELPTASFTTWAVWGGVFTNRPAADVHFRNEQIAAESAATVLNSIKENPMSEEKLSSLEAQLNVKDKELEALAAELKSARLALETAKQAAEKVSVDAGKSGVEIATLQAQVRAERAAKSELQGTVDSLSSELEKTREQLNAAKNENLSQAVKKVIGRALDRGVDAAVFEGSEKDPVRWMKTTFASFEAFEDHVSHLRGRKGAALSSGRQSHDDDDLPAGAKETLARLGLDPAFATVESESDLKLIKKG